MPVIFIPKPQTGIGGPQTFIRNLRAAFRVAGTPFTGCHVASTGILFPVSYPRFVLRLYRWLGYPIFQRLDGVFYPERNGPEYQIRNQLPAVIYREDVSHLIYQSRYSKQQCEAMFGTSCARAETIIRNGALVDVFNPAGRHVTVTDNGPISLVITGKIRDREMVWPVLEAMAHSKYQNRLQLTIIGDVLLAEQDMLALKNHPQVTLTGRQPVAKIAGALKQAHMLVFTHLNPPCPNTVIEASASGLPVVGFDSGALSEIVANRELLAAVADGGTLFQTADMLDTARLAAKIDLCLETYTLCQAAAKQAARKYDMALCAKAYADTIAAALPKRKHPLHVILLAADGYMLLRSVIRQLKACITKKARNLSITYLFS